MPSLVSWVLRSETGDGVLCLGPFEEVDEQVDEKVLIGDRQSHAAEPARHLEPEMPTA